MKYFFGFILVFFSICVHAQTIDTISPPTVMVNKNSIPSLTSAFNKSFSLMPINAPFSNSCSIQNQYEVNHLPGMFCKMENTLQGKSRIAPRFRLGSLAYTEWMEGKGMKYWNDLGIGIAELGFLFYQLCLCCVGLILMPEFRLVVSLSNPF